MFGSLSPDPGCSLFLLLLFLLSRVPYVFGCEENIHANLTRELYSRDSLSDDPGRQLHVYCCAAGAVGATVIAAAAATAATCATGAAVLSLPLVQQEVFDISSLLFDIICCAAGPSTQYLACLWYGRRYSSRQPWLPSAYSSGSR